MGMSKHLVFVIVGDRFGGLVAAKTRTRIILIDRTNQPFSLKETQRRSPTVRHRNLMQALDRLQPA